MVRVVRLIWLVAWVVAAQAATLEYLSSDELIDRSTAIVCGQVTGAEGTRQGPLIYTRYTVQVTERLKGAQVGAQVQVVVPGGVYQGQRQTFAGAPQLAAGKEYLLFLWTGPSGLTQVIGLSQGVFTLSRSSSGELAASRQAIGETMLDGRTGKPVDDQSMRIRLAELRALVASRVAAGGGNK